MTVASFGTLLLRRLLQRRYVDAVLGEKLGCTAHHRDAIHLADHAFAHWRVEVGHVRERKLALLGGRDHGHRQGMLTGTLHTRQLLQDVVRLEPRGSFDVNDLGPTLGQRARLVDHQCVDLLHALERFGVANQHAVLSAATRRRP